MTCCYLAGGLRCGREATTSRVVPLRDDPPGPDHVVIALCRVHDLAFSMWAGSRKIREAARGRP